MNNQTIPTPEDRPGIAREFLQNISLAWHLLSDPQVSFLVKLIPVAVVAYILLPFNFIPIFGQVDDLAAILIGLRLFIALSPPERVRWYRAGQVPSADPTSQDDSTIDGSYRIVDD